MSTQVTLTDYQAETLRRLIRHTESGCQDFAGRCDYEDFIKELAPQIPPEPIKAGDWVRRPDPQRTYSDRMEVLTVRGGMAYVIDADGDGGSYPVTVLERLPC